MFFQKSACSQSLSPNPFSRERGYITGATAPRPSKDACSQPHKATARCSGTNGWRPVWGLRPKARMLWLLAKSFARCKTNRASNKRHPFLIFTRGFSTAWNLADLFVRFCGGNVQKRFRSDNNSVKAARTKKIVYDIFKIEKFVPYPVIINVWKHHHVRIRGKCRLGYPAYDILLGAVVGSCGYYGNFFLDISFVLSRVHKKPVPATTSTPALR